MYSHRSLPQGHRADSCFPLWFTRTLRSFSAKLLPCQSVPIQYICIGLFHTGCRTSHLSLLNFRRLLSDLSSSLLRSLWVTALPSSILTANLVPSTDLLRVYCVPLFRLFMKTLKSIGPSVSPSETPAETGHYLDFVPLVTILCVKDTVNFPPILHVNFSSLYHLTSLAMWLKEKICVLNKGLLSLYPSPPTAKTC